MTRPVLIGIVGDSAAGKTTLSRGLASLLGEERVTRVCTDDYHRYDRAERARYDVTPLHPDSNYLDILELHLERLHYGQPILKPVYEHSTGSLVRPEYVRPREFVIVEGLLGYHSAAMRQFYDVKVFLEPAEELRRNWKLRRDTSRRGYSVEQVETELGRRERDSETFIRPQRELADVVVQFSSSSPALGADSPLDARLILRPTIPHPDFSEIFERSNGALAGIRFELGRDALRPVDILEIAGGVSPQPVRILQRAIFEHLPVPQSIPTEGLGTYESGGSLHRSDPLALAQLLLAAHALRARCGSGPLPFAPPLAALSRIRSPEAPATGEDAA